MEVDGDITADLAMDRIHSEQDTVDSGAVGWGCDEGLAMDRLHSERDTMNGGAVRGQSANINWLTNCSESNFYKKITADIHLHSRYLHDVALINDALINQLSAQIHYSPVDALN